MEEKQTEEQNDGQSTTLRIRQVHDASGLDIYLNECRRWKVVPNTQITRQLGNYQLQLRHNYLKAAEVSALTTALKVGNCNCKGADRVALGAPVTLDSSFHCLDWLSTYF